MIDLAAATMIAQAWAGEKFEAVPSTWPTRAFNLSGDDCEPRDDRHVFALLQRGEFRVGGCNYVGVHKVTGKVYDIGYAGE